MKKILLLLTTITCFAVNGVSQCVTGGTIGYDQTICYNSLPVRITEQTPAMGISSVAIYTWETSVTGNSPWVTIPAQSGLTYAFLLPQLNDAYIRRTITDPSLTAPCNTATSNVVHITVLPELTSGVIGTDEAICAGTVPSTITEISTPTGAAGTYTYQWQSDASGTFTDIPNATNATYSPFALTNTTQFRRVETSGMCGTVISNVITKTVSPILVTSVDINHPGQACAGTILMFKATPVNGGLAPSYQWYMHTNSTERIPVGTNSDTYFYTTASEDNGKYITVKIIPSETCALIAMSNSAFLSIMPSQTPTVSISTAFNPICEGFPIYFNAIPAYGGGTPTYQWYVKPSGSMIGTPVGTNSTTFTGSTLNNGDQVYVELISSLICIANNPVASNIVTLDIRPIPIPSIIEGDQTVCVGSAAEFHATTYAGNMVQWYYNGNIINGAKNSTYIATQMGLYSIEEKNTACSSVSRVINLTIDPCGAFSTAIDGPNPITPGQQDAAYSVFNQTGFSYDWSVTGGTIVSGGNTNEVTVDWDNSSSTLRTSSQGYTISVTETNPNQQQKTITMDVSGQSTGISKSLSQAGITLFPNPATDAFYIEMPQSGINVWYDVIDVTGLLVASGTFTSSSSGEKIETIFGPGIYQVILHYNNGLTTGRLSKVQ